MTVDAARDKVLASIGVDPDAETVWRLLLGNTDANILQLVRMTTQTRTEVEHSIGRLLDAQLLRIGSTPSGVEVVDPTIALEAKIARAERLAAEQAEAFTTIRHALPAIASDFNRRRRNSAELPHTEVVSDLGAIQQQIHLAIERVEHDARLMDHNPAYFEDPVDIDAQRAMIQRGVRDRAIIRTESLNNPGVFDTHLKMQERGHDARTHPAVSTRVLILDRTLAVLPVDNSQTSTEAIFIRVPSLVDTLVFMYEEVWNASTPIFSTPSNGGGPVGRHARILELLVQGRKDEAISRALGIGVRTIRRDVADLKSELGVSSRTEIVAAAVRKGWL